MPEDLKTFLSAVTSGIQDPRNRNTETAYLPNYEQQALKELEKLQKEKHIVKKPVISSTNTFIIHILFK